MMSLFKYKTNRISGNPRLERKGGETMLKLRNSKGFTLIELMVVIVVIGILAGIAIPRFMGAQDRSRIGAAESDINAMRQALGLYEIDHSSYDLGTINSYPDLVDALVDPNLNAYMSLPDTNNFTWGSYAGTDTSYTLVINAKDNNSTPITGTPEGVTR
jgi:prepilin-type N-terminal cleavage/methylation domain-containing protein